jgi:hypothetical protein
MLRHTYITTMQVSRVASDATFGRSREYALPAAQRTALWRAQRAGPPRGCGDLGRHRPPRSDATMMHLMPLHGMHHRCVGCHQGASGAPWLHEMHHQRSRRPAPCRRSPRRGARRACGSMITSRA